MSDSAEARSSTPRGEIARIVTAWTWRATPTPTPQFCFVSSRPFLLAFYATHHGSRQPLPPAMSGGAGGGGGRGWSPFDAIRSFPSTPESLMAQIDAAIASTEYARACTLLDPPPASASSQPQPPPEGEAACAQGATAPACHDARVADEAYRAACAALGAGRPDAAVRSLRVALASCPPEKTAAVAKVRSMLAIASAQLHKQQHQAQQSRK